MRPKGNFDVLSSDKEQRATAKEPEITVYLPSCKELDVPIIMPYTSYSMLSFLHAVDSTDMLGSKDIKEVLVSLWPARHKWHTIGIVVGIDNTTLAVIESDNIKRTDDCFREMLGEWLNSNNPVPCWKNLATALLSIDIKVLLRSGMWICFV